MGNSISNNSTNINVKNNYKNRNYGGTINGSYGNRPQVTSFNNTPVAMDEYDLSGPMVIKEQDVLMKSEVTEQIENWITYLDNTRKTLEEEKDTLTDKARRFTDSANRGKYPDLYYEENTKGRKKYLNPKEAIKSDKYFKKYLKENGYPTDKERFTTDEYNLLKQKYANYINTVYAEKYSKYFNEATGMTYEDYKERLTQIYSDIESIKASRYELVQQAKEQPYIELMDTDDFKKYVDDNKNNPNSELYKLYGIKNGTVPLDGDSYWRFTYFTEQDMLIFSYLWDTQSPKAAREYVEAIEDKLNKAEGLANAEKFLDSIRDENGNIDPDVWAGVLSGAKGFENGLSTFFEGLGNVFNGEGMMSTSQYEQMYILNELTNSSGNYISKLAQEMTETQGEEAAADFISKIYNKETNTIDLEYAKTVLSEQEYDNLVIKINTDKKSILDNVYELSSSAGNMLPSMLVSMAVSAIATPAAGSVVGSTLMGISSGGNSKNQALVQGNDLFTSTMYGVFSGVSETTLGLLLGNIPGLNESATFSFKGFVKEGMEEMLQEYVDAGLRASILDETIDLDQLGEDAFKSFIYGAVMSGIMNGGKLLFTIKSGNGTTRIDSVQELVDFASERGIDIDTSQVEGMVSEAKQVSIDSHSSSSEPKVQTSSINPGNLDIDGQITMANYRTDKGLTTTIDIDSVSSLSESQISSIKNVDNVIFRLPDGSNMSISQLLNARLNLSGKTISGSTNVSMDLDSQIARANMYNKNGNFASIDVTDITMMTDEVLSKIDNVDNVIFRLSDDSTVNIDTLRKMRDEFVLQRYTTNVQLVTDELYTVNPKLVELYSLGKETGKKIDGFLGYEEHNFLHVYRVAKESVKALKVIDSLLSNNTNSNRTTLLENYGKISDKIIYYAGLAHDLGMTLDTYSKYKLTTITDLSGKLQQIFYKISTPDGKTKIEVKQYEKVFSTFDSDVIRNNHALASAIIVLKEKLFGYDNEMISVLAALHSKSSSGVKDLSNGNKIAEVIIDLYNNRENCGYNFDISKFGTLQEVVGEDGITRQNFTFDNEVLKQIRTGAYVLRVGDAHAEKTGFNHGGGMFKIDKVPPKLSEEKYLLSCFGDKFDIDKLCFDEIDGSAISVEYLEDGMKRELSGTNAFEYSKRVIFGERNVYPVKTEIKDGHITYIHEVKTTNTPACTIEHGIIEKFGEYNTATGIPQDVVVVLPQNTPRYIFDLYKSILGDDSIKKIYGNINRIEIRWDNITYLVQNNG